jgi:DNA-binding transcriptional LysR family regulator
MNARSGRDFDWNLAKSFLAVLDAGSLSAASRLSGVSQPTLGRHVTELELALGVLLFERGRDGLLPTPAAIAISAEARRLAEVCSRMTLLAAGRSAAIEGTVRITASQIVSTYLLPQILGRMLQHLPGIEVELVASNEIENLLQRDADIALRMVEPQQLDLVSRKLATLELGVYAHREYLANHGAPKTPGEFRNHVVIGYDRSDLVIRGFASIGYRVDSSFFRMRTDDQVTHWEAVLAGAGIGFGPVWLGSRYPQLHRIGREFAIRPMQMWLVTHKELRSSARIRAVHDYLAGEVTKALAAS